MDPNISVIMRFQWIYMDIYIYTYIYGYHGYIWYTYEWTHGIYDIHIRVRTRGNMNFHWSGPPWSQRIFPNPSWLVQGRGIPAPERLAPTFPGIYIYIYIYIHTIVTYRIYIYVYISIYIFTPARWFLIFSTCISPWSLDVLPILLSCGF